MFGFLRRSLSNFEACLVMLKAASDLRKANSLRYEYILAGVAKHCHEKRRKISRNLELEIRLAASDLLGDRGKVILDQWDCARTAVDLDLCVDEFRNRLAQVGVFWSFSEAIEDYIKSAKSHVTKNPSSPRSNTSSDSGGRSKKTAKQGGDGPRIQATDEKVEQRTRDNVRPQERQPSAEQSAARETARGPVPVGGSSGRVSPPVNNLSKSEKIRRALPRPDENEGRPISVSAQRKELHMDHTAKNQASDSDSAADGTAPCDQLTGPLQRYISENISSDREQYSPSKVLYDFRRWLRETEPGVYEVYAHCFLGERLWSVREMVEEKMSKGR